jgi:hypothetical protein
MQRQWLLYTRQPLADFMRIALQLGLPARSSRIALSSQLSGSSQPGPILFLQHQLSPWLQPAGPFLAWACLQRPGLS